MQGLTILAFALFATASTNKYYVMGPDGGEYSEKLTILS